MYVLVDVLGFVIVLYQGGVFEYILFCFVCFATTWFLLHVYFLFGVLDFIIVLYQNRVFEYICCCKVVEGGGGGEGGAVVYICKTYFCTPRKLLRGAKNEVAREI